MKFKLTPLSSSSQTVWPVDFSPSDYSSHNRHGHLHGHLVYHDLHPGQAGKIHNSAFLGILVGIQIRISGPWKEQSSLFSSTSNNLRWLGTQWTPVGWLWIDLTSIPVAVLLAPHPQQPLSHQCCKKKLHEKCSVASVCYTHLLLKGTLFISVCSSADRIVSSGSRNRARVVRGWCRAYFKTTISGNIHIFCCEHLKKTQYTVVWSSVCGRHSQIFAMFFTLLPLSPPPWPTSPFLFLQLCTIQSRQL